MTLEAPQVLRPPTSDLSIDASPVLKELIFAASLQSCPATTANHVVLKAFLFMLVEPPFCGFRNSFGLSCSRMGKYGEAPCQRSVLVILPDYKPGESKAAYGTCESGSSK